MNEKEALETLTETYAEINALQDKIKETQLKMQEATSVLHEVNIKIYNKRKFCFLFWLITGIIVVGFQGIMSTILLVKKEMDIWPIMSIFLGFIMATSLVITSYNWICWHHLHITRPQRNELRKIMSMIELIVFLFCLNQMSLLMTWSYDNFVLHIIVLGVFIAILVADYLSNISNSKLLYAFELIGVVVTTFSVITEIPDTNIQLQNITVTLLSAIYGGLLTLLGVAWTIKHEDVKRQEDLDNHAKERMEDLHRIEQEKKELEIKNAKPFFTFNLVFQPPTNINGIKTCVTDLDINYDNELYAELENSNHAPFIIKRIEHDGQWFGFSANTQILQSGKVVISWLFNSFLDMYLEVEDLLGNLYYYSIKVVTFNHISEINKLCYTIRELKEVSINEIREKKLL